MENNIKFSTLGCRLNSYETESMRNMAGTVGLNNAVVINIISKKYYDNFYLEFSD